MGLITTSPAIAVRQKRVALFAPGPPVPDDDGGYTEVAVALAPPALWARVRPASARDIEQLVGGGTVLAQATHIVSVPYHPQISTQTTLVVEEHPRPARRLAVVFVGNTNERDAGLELVCAEVVA